MDIKLSPEELEELVAYKWDFEREGNALSCSERFFYELCNDLEAHPELAVSEDFTKIIYLKKLHHLTVNAIWVFCHMEWHHFRLERR